MDRGQETWFCCFEPKYISVTLEKLVVAQASRFFLMMILMTMMMTMVIMTSVSVCVCVCKMFLCMYIHVCGGQGSEGILPHEPSTLLLEIDSLTG